MSFFDRALAASLPLVPSPIVRRVASRYVAGETLDAAAETVARLNSEGASGTLDVLGEGITRPDETRFFVEEYCRALDRIRSRGLDSNVSVKLSSMGLAIDTELAHRNFLRVVERAEELGIFVRIDMEDSSLTQRTIDLFRKVREGHPNVGIVLQAYLRRTESDVAQAIQERWSVRICKGIYVEPEEIAFRAPDEIRANYARLTDRMLAAGVPLGIATHDESLVREAADSIRRHHPSRDDYEFQMLLGVANPLRHSLIAAGHRLRVYVPYGRAWRAYSLRRLKENPAIARYVLLGIFKK